MSGIYIPGMEMPRKTGIVSVVLAGDGSALLCEDGVYSDITVIPVPDHGRLIDADALDDLLMNLADNEYTPKVFASWLSYEENAPTIIPAEEEDEA